MRRGWEVFWMFIALFFVAGAALCGLIASLGDKDRPAEFNQRDV